MSRLSRYSFAVALTVAGFSTLASADLKIKTRTTMMGHSTESTVYIKGGRERTEMSFGGHGGAVTIMQCDQKRIITISGNQCSVISTGGNETSCPAMPNMRAMGRENAEAEPVAPRKGGVVTITRNSTDTGERQDMFGYKARHIKTSMIMESTPDACNQSHMKMETDGWYADLSAGFSCADESYRAMACGGMGGGRAQCNDRIVMKGGGGGAMGYPLKQTTTIMSEHGNFTTTTEVIELTNATLEAPLFDMPPGCKVTDMSAMMSGAAAAAQAQASHEPAAAAPKAPPAPAAPLAPAPAASVAPKAAGVVRIGVVKIKDASGQGLPTDNLRLNLMDEITRRQMEAVPLVAEAPPQDVESEASSKQCDYILYTVASQVKDPGTGGLPPASVPKGVTLDAAKFQALTNVTLYKVGKPVAEINGVGVAAEGAQFGVDAVMAIFPLESEKVAQQVEEDAHPKAPAKVTKAPAKKPAAAPKPKQ
ncbi:MAG TPA: hypothetical protein VII23_25235 [Terriglobales bacterium]